MEHVGPSRTAYGTAMLRAAHQLLDGGKIFSDPLAVAICGVSAETILSDELAHLKRDYRFFVSARAAFAEAKAKAAIAERGLRQIVLLGSGLDTFAYRAPATSGLRIFDVDHPATQAWKQQRVAALGVEASAELTFVPVDFEREQLKDALLAAGFAPDVRTFFIWLGVVPYLVRESVDSTLAFIGGLTGGSELVFDYGEPPAALSEEMQAKYRQLGSKVAAQGEPFKSYFEPGALHSELRRLGFVEIDDVGARELADRLEYQPLTPFPEGGAHLVFAMTRVVI